MNRGQDPTLVPGTRAPPRAPLRRHRRTEIHGLVRHSLDALTEPGDILLHMAAHTAAYVREGVEARRRILAANVNPVPLTWMHLALTTPAPSRLSATLTALGDIPKEGAPFVHYVRDAYRSPCPVCQHSGTLAWMRWDRDGDRPLDKAVACPHCAASRVGPVAAEDTAILERFTPKSGIAYYLALGRAAGPGDPQRARVAELVALYTPRNLSLLFDILNRLERLDLEPNRHAAMIGLFLEALDRGSRLVPAQDPESRLQSLHPAKQYLEMNVWSVLEETIGALDQGQRERPAQAPDLETLLISREPGYLLLPTSIQQLIRSGYEGTFDGLILEVQPPDAVLWALSALWSSWIWRDATPTSLKHFLSRRRLGWEWYRRSLSVGLAQARRLLKRNAYALCIVSTDHAPAIEALLAASQDSGFRRTTWLGDPEDGYGLLLEACEAPVSAPAPYRTPMGAAAAAVRNRGEPTAWEHLRIAAMTMSGGQALNRQDLAHSPRWEALRDDRWSLKDLTRTAQPLADRVEDAVIELVNARVTWSRPDLRTALYRRFNQELSPERELVEACIDAYTERSADGKPDVVTRRAEDEPARREAEIQSIQEDLLALGDRLGFRTASTPDGEIVWLEGSDTAYRFRCTASAVIAPHLSSEPEAGGGQPCLILPGGRAALVDLKLRRDPRLRAWLDRHRWRFIKFRHLRRMVEEVHNRPEIEVFLGLDPIVEQSQAQIPLPLNS